MRSSTKTYLAALDERRSPRLSRSHSGGSAECRHRGRPLAALLVSTGSRKQSACFGWHSCHIAYTAASFGDNFSFSELLQCTGSGRQEEKEARFFSTFSPHFCELFISDVLSRSCSRKHETQPIVGEDANLYLRSQTKISRFRNSVPMHGLSSLPEIESRQLLRSARRRDF